MNWILMLVAATALAATVVGPRPAQAFEPGATECIVPANPGSGQGFTCRAVGEAMVRLGLVPEAVQITHMPGGDGEIAFDEVVMSRAEDNDLFVAASMATAVRLAEGDYAGHTMNDVRWLGAVGTDYGVIAVVAASDFNTLPALMDAIKADPAAITVAGVSGEGGWDHLKVLIAAQAAGIRDLDAVKYQASDSAEAALKALTANSVDVFSGSASEVTDALRKGEIKVLAVLSPERIAGAFAEIPTAKEQGIDATAADWRGFFGPKNMSQDAYAYWVSAIEKVAASDRWKDVMRENGLAPLDVSGANFEAFVAEKVEEIRKIAKEIGVTK